MRKGESVSNKENGIDFAGNDAAAMQTDIADYKRT